jgi:hypothetical protein
MFKRIRFRARRKALPLEFNDLGRFCEFLLQDKCIIVSVQSVEVSRDDELSFSNIFKTTTVTGQDVICACVGSFLDPRKATAEKAAKDTLMRALSGLSTIKIQMANAHLEIETAFLQPEGELLAAAAKEMELNKPTARERFMKFPMYVY